MTKNPRRVEAGRRNHAKRKGFTESGLERLRAAALATQPWKHSTGPRTPEGKRRSSQNGRYRQTGLVSRREAAFMVSEFESLLEAMAQTRQAAVEAIKERC